MVKVGYRAPNFSLPDTETRVRGLKEFLGQKVVLVFFVEAFTSICTQELCEFRDAAGQLIDLKAQVVGIDVHRPAANKLLAQKLGLTFPILSDSKREVIEKYGLAVPNLARRPSAKHAIVILDENGFVRYIWVSDVPSVEPPYEEMKKFLGQTVEVAWSPPTVITISRLTSSGGDEIASKLCEKLGYAYFDKNLLVSIGKSVGVTEEDIADFCEDTYKVKSLVDKILRRKRPIMEPLDVTGSLQIRKTLDEEDCLSVIQTVVNNLASKGKIVIVGRGGQAILKDKVGVLHVRVIAPLECRVQRIVKTRGLSQKDARRLIEANDKGAAEYLRRFYGIDWEDPMNYDLVVNTGKMDLASAVNTITSVLPQTQQQPNKLILST